MSWVDQMFSISCRLTKEEIIIVVEQMLLTRLNQEDIIKIGRHFSRGIREGIANDLLMDKEEDE